MTAKSVAVSFCSGKAKFEVLRGGRGFSRAATSRTAKLEGGLTLYSLGNLEEHFILAHALGKIRPLTRNSTTSQKYGRLTVDVMIPAKSNNL